MIFKIQTASGQGFPLESSAEALLWAKCQFFERGIGPEEFRRSQMRDIKDIMQIKNAVIEKRIREEEVQKMMNKIN